MGPAGLRSGHQDRGYGCREAQRPPGPQAVLRKEYIVSLVYSAFFDQGH